MRIASKYGWLILAALLLGWMTSCVGMQRDPNSDLPSNAPASWEGKTLGVPI